MLKQNDLTVITKKLLKMKNEINHYTHAGWEPFLRSFIQRERLFLKKELLKIIQSQNVTNVYVNFCWIDSDTGSKMMIPFILQTSDYIGNSIGVLLEKGEKLF